MDLQTYRQTSLRTWAEMAPGWEDRREWVLGLTGPVNEWLVDQVDPQPGETILDLAAGTGDLGFLAVERMGGDGTVLCTDFSPEMVEASRRNGERLGLSNVDYRVLDAEQMDLAEDSVDKALCRWGYMLMADPARALAETRRVLRDGGALAFAVWAPPQRNLWLAIPGMTLVERGHMPPPEPNAPGVFAMADPARVVELVTGAGFDEPRVEELEFEWRYDRDDLWDSITRLAGPLAIVINALPADEQEAMRTAIEERLGQFRQNGDFVVPASTWVVVAR